MFWWIQTDCHESESNRNDQNTVNVWAYLIRWNDQTRRGARLRLFLRIWTAVGEALVGGQFQLGGGCGCWPCWRWCNRWKQILSKTWNWAWWGPRQSFKSETETREGAWQGTYLLRIGRGTAVLTWSFQRFGCRWGRWGDWRLRILRYLPWKSNSNTACPIPSLVIFLIIE